MTQFSVIEAPHPSGDTILFYEKKHFYKSKQRPDIKFTSGTGFLKHFFEPFDKERVSKMCAQKWNRDQQEILKEWEEKGRKARVFGTLMHKYAEDLLLDKNPERIDTTSKHLNTCLTIEDSVRDIKKDFDLLGVERIVASHDLGIAGTIDLLLKRKKDGKVFIDDWKTNEKMKLENPFQSGKAPIEHLQEHDFNKYSLQLNLYQRIMEREGYVEPGTEFVRRLHHVTPKGCMIYTCPDMHEEIDQMTEYFLEAA